MVSCKNWYLTLVILFNTIHTVKWFQVLRCITNNSIKHQSFVHTQLNNHTVLFQSIQFSMSFVYTQLNGQRVPFLTNRFNISNLFALSLNVKQSYLIHRQNHIGCYYSRLVWTREQWQYSAFPKVPALLETHYHIFSAISRPIVGVFTLL